MQTDGWTDGLDKIHQRVCPNEWVYVTLSTGTHSVCSSSCSSEVPSPAPYCRLFPSILQLVVPSLYTSIHQPVFPCQALGLRQEIDKERSMGQSLTSECLCNWALFSWNQIILLISLWCPSGCTRLCFCCVPWGPLTRNTLAALLRAAPFRAPSRLTLHPLPAPLPTALPPLSPMPSAWRPTLSWAVSSLCQSLILLLHWCQS